MSNDTNIRKNIVAAAAALAVSSACILGTIGPVNAGPNSDDVQLADANGIQADEALHA